MNVNNLGSAFLVEDCQKVDVSDLLRDYKAKLKETILRSQFDMLNENVLIVTSKTGNGGLRFWFMCPRCKRRVGILLKHPLQNVLGCRTCLKLEYKSRRYKGMVENK
ncbi:hypothetical protein H6804_00035 [Candidatus Nomurabacteria bacterium]|nr:hypothetical protein [Candidatus Nomurabacteria bacterium]MCB9826654.1 hypothetical protein [Candidatus Nomurabacteria bacterium]